MNLGNPGADLVGANEAAALRVLARRIDAVSGREVARIAQVSPPSIRRALARLVQIGLVTVRGNSHASLYAANRDHVLWEPVSRVLGATGRVQAALGALVAARMADRATVAVFGSLARADAYSHSDVDNVLIFDQNVAPADRESLVDDDLPGRDADGERGSGPRRLSGAAARDGGSARSAGPSLTSLIVAA